MSYAEIEGRLEKADYGECDVIGCKGRAVLELVWVVGEHRDAVARKFCGGDAYGYQEDPEIVARYPYE